MGGLIYGGAYIRTRFCVSNIEHLLTLFLYNTRLIYKQASVYIRVGLYTGGLIFGMVRVLINWWAYTWGGGLYSGGLIFRGLRYMSTGY